MRDIINDNEWYTRDELRKMSRFRLRLLKIRIRMMILYYSCKSWLLLRLLGFRSLFDPEAKLLYTEAKYKWRKSNERR